VPRGELPQGSSRRYRALHLARWRTPNPLIWGSGTPFTAEQQERNAYLGQKETERAAAVLLLYPDV
jgi:hypothetical protein